MATTKTRFRLKSCNTTFQSMTSNSIYTLLTALVVILISSCISSVDMRPMSDQVGGDLNDGPENGRFWQMAPMEPMSGIGSFSQGKMDTKPFTMEPFGTMGPFEFMQGGFATMEPLGSFPNDNSMAVNTGYRINNQYANPPPQARSNTALDGYVNNLAASPPVSSSGSLPPMPKEYYDKSLSSMRGGTSGDLPLSQNPGLPAANQQLEVMQKNLPEASGLPKLDQGTYKAVESGQTHPASQGTNKSNGNTEIDSLSSMPNVGGGNSGILPLSAQPIATLPLAGQQLDVAENKLPELKPASFMTGVDQQTTGKNESGQPSSSLPQVPLISNNDLQSSGSYNWNQPNGNPNYVSPPKRTNDESSGQQPIVSLPQINQKLDTMQGNLQDSSSLQSFPKADQTQPLVPDFVPTPVAPQETSTSTDKPAQSFADLFKLYNKISSIPGFNSKLDTPHDANQSGQPPATYDSSQDPLNLNRPTTNNKLQSIWQNYFTNTQSDNNVKPQQDMYAPSFK